MDFVFRWTLSTVALNETAVPQFMQDQMFDSCFLLNLQMALMIK